MLTGEFSIKLRLILGVCFKTVLTVWIFCAAGSNTQICVKHPCFIIHSAFAATSIFEALSAAMAT